jgi:excisionase family DNA binding protein
MATADIHLQRGLPKRGPRPEPGTGDASDVISIDEVARRLDIPKATLYAWRYKRIGPRSHRVGKHLRYRWSEVLQWLDAQD